MEEAVAKLKAELFGPKGKYQIVRKNVHGINLLCFAKGVQNLREFFDQKFSQYSNSTFIVFEGERYTFKEVWERVAALGYTLRRHYGIQQGDRVAICMQNCPEWCISFIAIGAIGGICVPLNSWWKGKELAYGLSDSGTKVLIADAARMAGIASHLPKLGVKGILVRPLKRYNSGIPELRSSGILQLWAEIVRQNNFSLPLPISSRGIDEDAAIMYTSGTTGHPKGVVLTNRGILDQMRMAEVADIMTKRLLPPAKDPPCSIVPVPLFHATASHHLFLSSICLGSKLVLMRRWDAAEALRLIECERPTRWTGVPTMAQDLIQHPDFTKRNLSSLKQFGSGGAPTPPKQVEEMNKKFGGAAAPSNGYGLTETNGAVCTNSGPAYLAKPSSTGPPFPIVEVKIVDSDSGREVPTGERGELLVKSSLVMRCYWNKPDATKKALISLNGDPGWFRTGDIAKVDKDGFVYILDRAKQIIIRGGENIACAEVEAALFEHECVMECAIFGLPDTRLGEKVAAMIMLKTGFSPSRALAEEVERFGRERLASFKVPLAADIHFTDKPLPRGATGKVQKRDIQQQILAQQKLTAKM